MPGLKYWQDLDKNDPYAGSFAKASMRQAQVGREGVGAANVDATSAGYAQQRGALGQAGRAGMQAGIGRGASGLARRQGMQTSATAAGQGVNQSALLRAQEVQQARRAHDAALGQQVEGQLGFSQLEQQQNEWQKAYDAARDAEAWRAMQAQGDTILQTFGAVAGAAGKAGQAASDERIKDKLNDAAAGAAGREAAIKAGADSAGAQEQETSELLARQRARAEGRMTANAKVTNLASMKGDPNWGAKAFGEGLGSMGSAAVGGGGGGGGSMAGSATAGGQSSGGGGDLSGKVAARSASLASQAAATSGEVAGSVPGQRSAVGEATKLKAGIEGAPKDTSAALSTDAYNAPGPAPRREVGKEAFREGVDYGVEYGPDKITRGRGERPTAPHSIDYALRPAGVERGRYGVVDDPGLGSAIQVGGYDNGETVIPEGTDKTARASMAAHGYNVEDGMSPGTARPMALQDWSAGGGYVQYDLNGRAISDERAKGRTAGLRGTDQEAAQTMRSLNPYHWKYKPEAQQALGLTGRERVSPSAQNIEKTPLGRNIVTEGPTGLKQVDIEGATLQGLTMMSSLQRQIDELKRKRREARA